MKQGMRKVKKLELKPWVTKGIKTSMKLRDKLYKEAIKENDSQTKIKIELTKKYRNKIVDQLKVGKQTHYKKYFEENKRTAKLFGIAFMKSYIQRKRKIPSPNHHCS